MSNLKLAQTAIMNQEKRFAEIAPDMAFKKEAMYAMQAMSNNTYLASTDPKSVASAVLGVAMSGLTLNPALGHAYLVPRKGKAVFQPGYQGLIYLLIKSKMVKQVEARVVHENDEFSLEYGTDTRIVHKPALKDKGNIIGFYAIATDPTGSKYIEYMGADEVMANAMRSDMNKKTNSLTGAWQTDFIEMGRKTIIRRLFKYLPKHTDDSSFLSKLSEAMGSMDAQQGHSVSSSDILDIDAEVSTEPILVEQVPSPDDNRVTSPNPAAVVDQGVVPSGEPVVGLDNMFTTPHGTGTTITVPNGTSTRPGVATTYVATTTSETKQTVNSNKNKNK